MWRQAPARTSTCVPDTRITWPRSLRVTRPAVRSSKKRSDGVHQSDTTAALDDWISSRLSVM